MLLVALLIALVIALVIAFRVGVSGGGIVDEAWLIALVVLLTKCWQ